MSAVLPRRALGRGLALGLVALLGVGACGGDGSRAGAPGTTAPAVGAGAPGGDLRTDDDPASLLVLVNKEHGLPDGWVPPDLVEPGVPFSFSGHDPKRLLRAEAADALEALFAAAARDGLPLEGVSGYRSEQRQRDVFDASVRDHGEAAALQTSARPGHSEHQTGLAMDVTSADGTCPAEDCFATTPEAAWLAAHAPEHGFVVRYPAGREGATGYAHEPWHLRYVGVAAARELAASGRVLEDLPR